MNNTNNNTGYQLFMLYFRNKFWIIGSVTGFLLLAYFYLRQVTPKYRVTCQVQISGISNAVDGRVVNIINKVNSLDNFESAVKEQRLDSVSNEFRQNLVIGNEGRQNKLILSLLSTDTTKAKKFIGSLINNYNRKPILLSSGRARQFELKDSLAKMYIQLSELQIISSKLHDKYTRLKTSKLNVITSHDSEKDQVQNKLFDVFISYLKHPLSQYSILPYADEIVDPGLKRSVDQFNRLENDKQLKLRDYKESDVQIKEMNASLMRSQKEILEAIILQKALSNKENPDGPIPNKVKLALRDSIHQNESLIKARAEARTNLILKYNQSLADSSVASLKVLKEAQAGSVPEYPKKSITYILAIGFGLILPAFIPYAWMNLKANPLRISLIEKVQRLTGISTYGIFKMSNQYLIEVGHEVLIAVSRELQHRPGPYLLLITGIMTETENMAFIRLLANQLQSAKSKTVLVDFDLKESTMSKGLDIYDRPGVVNYLEKSGIGLDDLLIPSTESENLLFLGAGTAGIAGSDPLKSFFDNNQLASPWVDENKLDALINSPRVKTLLNELRLKFDYVIVSASAVDQPADFFPLVPFSDLEMIIIPEHLLNKARLKHLRYLAESRRFNHPAIFYID